MKWILCSLFVSLPALVSAQTPVLNPTQIEFVASPDHAATSLSGAAVVTRYDVSWIAQNVTGAVAFTKQLGKPAPDTTGKILVVIPELQTITEETVFRATIVAVGPGGATPSAPSNAFGRPGPPRLPAAPGSVVVKP